MEVEAALKRVAVVVALSLLLGMPAFSTSAAAHQSMENQDAPEVVRDEEYEERGIRMPVQGSVEDVGRILDPIDGEVPAVSLALMPGGSLLYFSGAEADEAKDGPTDLHFMWEATPTDAESRAIDITDIYETNEGIQVDFDLIQPEHVEDQEDTSAAGLRSQAPGKPLRQDPRRGTRSTRTPRTTSTRP